MREADIFPIEVDLQLVMVPSAANDEESADDEPEERNLFNLEQSQ